MGNETGAWALEQDEKQANGLGPRSQDAEAGPQAGRTDGTARSNRTAEALESAAADKV